MDDLITAFRRTRAKPTLTSNSPTPRPEASFEEFLLAEYTNIAQAHFNTVDSVSNFVKHYLLIASAPIFLVVLFADLRDMSPNALLSALATQPLAPALVGSGLLLMGLLVLGYVINI